MSKPTKGDLFLELAKPNSEGFSDAIPISEFQGRYDKLQMGNGGDWCRDDGPLARRFNIRRHKQGGRIVSVELQGYKKQSIKKPIPTAIREKVTASPCVILATSKTECDHKDGRRDDPKLADASKVGLEDFQPLSKAANSAKRQHCKECRTTGKRFDAKRLGYCVSQLKGNGDYNGTCIGCYWHDPKRFNREVSEWWISNHRSFEETHD